MTVNNIKQLTNWPDDMIEEFWLYLKTGVC
jgi:hypothetical protein